jgi:hypothetical protein
MPTVHSASFGRRKALRASLFRIVAISVGLVLASTAAEAKGCIKGAIVGGLVVTTSAVVCHLSAKTVPAAGPLYWAPQWMRGGTV